MSNAPLFAVLSALVAHHLGQLVEAGAVVERQLFANAFYNLVGGRNLGRLDRERLIQQAQRAHVHLQHKSVAHLGGDGAAGVVVVDGPPSLRSANSQLDYIEPNTLCVIFVRVDIEDEMKLPTIVNNRLVASHTEMIIEWMLSMSSANK